MIIYKLTDRIPISIGEIKFWFSPLSYDHRIAISECTTMKAGVEVDDNVRGAFLSIKYGIKECEGLKCVDGSSYELTFEPGGSLTDDCVSELLSMEMSPKIVSAAARLSSEIKDHLIEGVKINIKETKSAKKKVG